MGKCNAFPGCTIFAAIFWDFYSNFRPLFTSMTMYAQMTTNLSVVMFKGSHVQTHQFYWAYRVAQVAQLDATVSMNGEHPW